MGYRTYSAQLMCFQSPDSWSPFEAGGINPYVYCEDDPVNRSDPTGHLSAGQYVGMALGFVAGFTLSIATEGAAMPFVLTLMSTVAGDMVIGAGTELLSETIDGRSRDWGQVGLAAGLCGLTRLAGYGMGMLSGLKGTASRPLGGLIMEGDRIVGDTITRFRSGPQQSSTDNALNFIRQRANFRHDIDLATGRILSTRMSENSSIFESRFEPERWTFMVAKREMDEPYYMNHVVRYQYESVSKALRFYGQLPQSILWDNVINSDTSYLTFNQSGQNLSDIFFRQTPLGKTTRRILDEFKIEPESVERKIVKEYCPIRGKMIKKLNILVRCVERTE